MGTPQGFYRKLSRDVRFAVEPPIGRAFLYNACGVNGGEGSRT